MPGSLRGEVLLNVFMGTMNSVQKRISSPENPTQAMCLTDLTKALVIKASYFLYGRRKE